jgi:transcriptional regulator with XRE-family HTH domain
MADDKEKTGKRGTTAIDQAIGERIRARRLQIGMSQQRLATLLGITFQQVQKYEKAANRVSAATLLTIAKILDAPMSALLPDYPVAHQATTAPGDHNTSGLAELCAVYARLNPTAKKRALHLMRTLASEQALLQAEPDAARPASTAKKAPAKRRK